MIDIHCHILPQVDDGPKDMDEALKMAKLAYEDGIRTIINTSHFYDTDDFIKGEGLKEKLNHFQKRLKDENIDIEMLLGNEAYISPSLPTLAEKEAVYTLNGSRYILLELPLQDMPIYTEAVIYELRLKGFIPIIAHPERYTKIIENPNIAKDLIDQGALMQINSGSIRGRFGQAVQETAYTLLKHNMVHLIGSDGHSPRSRRPTLQKAFYMVSEIIGKDYTNILFYENPRRVIQDKDLDILKPMEVLKQKNTSINFFTNLLEKYSPFTKKRVSSRERY